MTKISTSHSLWPSTLVCFPSKFAFHSLRQLFQITPSSLYPSPSLTEKIEGIKSKLPHVPPLYLAKTEPVLFLTMKKYIWPSKMEIYILFSGFNALWFSCGLGITSPLSSNATLTVSPDKTRQLN
jgi:hypothetical protein